MALHSHRQNWRIAGMYVSTADWGKIFDVDNTLATAMIDRLMHHAEAFVIRGDSYRMKDKDQDEE